MFHVSICIKNDWLDSVESIVQSSPPGHQDGDVDQIDPRDARNAQQQGRHRLCEYVARAQHTQTASIERPPLNMNLQTP